MTKLKRIWIERDLDGNEAIRIDWNNDRHHRIEIKGDDPKDLIKALDFARMMLEGEIMRGDI